jgi:prevent-host-death family protein
MEVLTANKAKTHFGELLIKAQKQPVQIDKNGKPIAVVISIEDYEASEQIKISMLKHKIEQAENEIKHGLHCDGNSFFEKLIEDID